MRKKIAHALENGPLSHFIQLLILVSVLAFTLETMPWAAEYSTSFALLDYSITVLFFIELSTRLLVFEKPFRYLFSFYGVVDVLAILPTLAGLDSKGLRVVRLIRLLKLLRNEKINQAMARLSAAFQSVKSEMIIFSVVVLLTLYFALVGIYLFEHEAQPEAFSSIPASMWWALATLTTVGYGDIYPITSGGKIFAGFVILVGIGIVAIPTGLFASALTAVKEQSKAHESDGADGA